MVPIKILAGGEADKSSPPSVEVKNKWVYNSTPLYASMTWIETNCIRTVGIWNYLHNLLLLNFRGTILRNWLYINYQLDELIIIYS